MDAPTASATPYPCPYFHNSEILGSPPNGPFSGGGAVRCNAQLSDAAGRCTPPRPWSLDHPISAQKHRRRERHALSFRRLEIEYQLEARRLLDGQPGWVCAF